MNINMINYSDRNDNVDNTTIIFNAVKGQNRSDSVLVAGRFSVCVVLKRID